MKQQAPEFRAPLQIKHFKLYTNMIMKQPNKYFNLHMNIGMKNIRTRPFH